MQFMFGAGSLYGIDNSASPPTPVQFGAVQEVGVEFSFSMKELHSQYQFPLAVARSKSKIACKAKSAQLQADLMNTLFFGGTKITGSVLTAVDELGTIPTTPFQITVANSATWQTDLGVYFKDTGLPLTRVTSAPATCQYSVAAGIYTFAAADTGKQVYIDYTYTSASDGKLITITNPLMGVAPTFKAILNGKFSGKDITLTLNSCISNKLSLATKLEDYMIPEFDFEAMADVSNVVGTISLAEAF